MIYHAIFHLIVRQIAEGSYELIAGERRLMAAIASNHTTIPAKILNLSDRDAHSLAMAENLQREDLNVYEETLAVVALIGALLEIESIDETKAIISDFYNESRRLKRSDGSSETTIDPNFDILGGSSRTTTDSNLEIVQEVIASNLKGMSVQSFVTNRLSLLDLPVDIVAAIGDGLSYNKALAIAKVEDVDARDDLIQTVSGDNFNLSEVKKMIKGLKLTDRVESESGDSKASPNLKIPKTRLTSILRQVKSMKQFDRLNELNDLLDRMEALM